MKERIDGLTLFGCILLAFALFIGTLIFADTVDTHTKEIRKYQDRAIAAGTASRDSEGTFYWIEKTP